MTLDALVFRLGGVASRRQLAQLGHHRRSVDRALAAQTILPVRPGWVANSTANQLAVLAVLRGGRLTGATALRSYGVWAGADLRVHIQLPRNSHRRIATAATPVSSFQAPLHRAEHVVVGWAPFAETPPLEPAWRVSVEDALVRFAKREDDEQVVAALESAVLTGLVSRSAVPMILSRLPRRLRRLLARLNYRAESGLESIGRYRLENLGYRLEQQVQIGPDRVDVLIDGWLVIEFDGDRWHDPIADRRRTNRLIRAGYRALRFGYFDVIEQWHVTLATIQEMHSERNRPAAIGTPRGRATVAGRSPRGGSRSPTFASEEGHSA